MLYRTAFILWLFVQIAFCQARDTCNVEYKQNGCARKVTINFKEEVINDRKVFTISFKGDLKEETIAECSWDESKNANCDPVKGFICGSEENKSFSVEIDAQRKCLKSGEFSFDVALDEIYQCKVGKDEVKESDFDPYTTTGKETISSGNASTSSNQESRSKCPEEKDNNTGMVVGVVCGLLVIISVAVLLVICKKRAALVTSIRKRLHSENDVEAEACNRPTED